MHLIKMEKSLTRINPNQSGMNSTEVKRVKNLTLKNNIESTIYEFDDFWQLKEFVTKMCDSIDEAVLEECETK